MSRRRDLRLTTTSVALFFFACSSSETRAPEPAAPTGGTQNVPTDPGGTGGQAGGSSGTSGAGGFGGAGSPSAAGAPGMTAGSAGTAGGSNPAGGAGSGGMAQGGAASGGTNNAGAGVVHPEGAELWPVDNLDSIGGHETSVIGAPVVIETEWGNAVEFDGVDDALFVEDNPVEGLGEFTVEVFFRPDSGGVEAQRFFHLAENGSGNRVLFETRLPGDGTWLFDTFVESNAAGVALFNDMTPHPLDQWYHLACVIDGQTQRHYVNGMHELSVDQPFSPPLTAGRTSIGVRINQLYFFKGAIRFARFTPRVLAPAEFLPVDFRP